MADPAKARYGQTWPKAKAEFDLVSAKLTELHDTILWHLSEAELARLDGRVERLRKAEDSLRNKAVEVLGSMESIQAKDALREITMFCEPVALFEANSKERVGRMERIRKQVVDLSKK